MDATKLSVLARSRDNNFNLMRLLAALAVLFSHSFVIVTGNSHSVPLVKWLGMTPGAMAVDVFFVSSGFLVCASLLGRQNVLRFLLARAFRIYPAMLVMVGLSVLLLGMFFSSLSLDSFLLHEKTLRYVTLNSTLLFGTTGALPTVFTDVPFPGPVNASLWTLPFELRMYGLLLLLWVLLMPLARLRPRAYIWLLVAVATGFTILHLKVVLMEGVVDQRFRLTSMFFIGSVFFVFRERIFLSTPAAAVCATLLLLATVLGTAAFTVVYQFVIAYLILWVAYMPGGHIRAFNHLGDYSYGTYIWAFPVQQACISVWPSLGIAQHIIVSTFVTLVFAAASWHLVERPALRHVRRGEQSIRTLSTP